MSEIPPDDARALYEDIRKHIESRFEMRTQFFGNLVGYIIAFILVWGIWLKTGNGLQNDMKANWLATLITAGWSMGIVVHFINWIFYEMRENAIRREMERVGLHTIPRSELAKVKRDERLVRLSEDGELEEVVYDEIEQARSSKR